MQSHSGVWRKEDAIPALNLELTFTAGQALLCGFPCNSFSLHSSMRWLPSWTPFYKYLLTPIPPPQTECLDTSRGPRIQLSSDTIFPRQHRFHRLRVWSYKTAHSLSQLTHTHTDCRCQPQPRLLPKSLTNRLSPGGSSKPFQLRRSITSPDYYLYF